MHSEHSLDPVDISSPLPLPQRHLGCLGRDIPVLGAGCWTIGGAATNRGVPIGWDNVNPGAAFRGLVRAYELGVRLFDTADVYGLGQSERFLGRLLDHIPRDEVIIASKVGYFAGTAEHAYRPRQMLRQFETTLDNLGTDYLDAYYLHSHDFGPGYRYLDGAVNTMHTLREQGRIRAIGMRAPHEFVEGWAIGTDPRARAAADWLDMFRAIRPDVLTVRHNVFSRRYRLGQTDIFTFAAKHDVDVIIKQALAQGLLFRTPGTPPPARSEHDHRSTDPEFEPDHLQRLDLTLAALRAAVGDNPVALTRAALRHVMQRVPDAPILLGFRDADQITTTLSSLGAPLTPDETIAIDTALHAPDNQERTTDRAVHRS